MIFSLIYFTTFFSIYLSVCVCHFIPYFSLVYFYFVTYYDNTKNNKSNIAYLLFGLGKYH